MNRCDTYEAKKPSFVDAVKEINELERKLGCGISFHEIDTPSHVSMTITERSFGTCQCSECIKQRSRIQKGTNMQENEVVYRGEVCIVKTKMGTDVFVDGDLDKFILGVYHSKQLFDKKIKPLLEEEKKRHRDDVDGYRNDYIDAKKKHINALHFAVMFGIVAGIQSLYIILT